MLPNTPINRAKLEILSADYERCRNADCETPRFMLSVHRVFRASHGGKYTLKNGVTLCAVCHNFAEGKGNPKDIHGEKTTGDQWLLSKLSFWISHPDDRFEPHRQFLREKIEKLELFRSKL